MRKGIEKAPSPRKDWEEVQKPRKSPEEARNSEKAGKKRTKGPEEPRGPRKQVGEPQNQLRSGLQNHQTGFGQSKTQNSKAPGNLKEMGGKVWKSTG